MAEEELLSIKKSAAEGHTESGRMGRGSAVARRDMFRP
jgi:hypothetical protein